MKLTIGWWKARDGSKWHVDWAGPCMAVGHNEVGECRIWRSDGIATSGNDSKDLTSPWTEPMHSPVPKGLSMRDWFAGMALSNRNVEEHSGLKWADYVADQAYAIADAMLKARNA